MSAGLLKYQYFKSLRKMVLFLRHNYGNSLQNSSLFVYTVLILNGYSENNNDITAFFGGA